jgi:phospholipase C
MRNRKHAWHLRALAGVAAISISVAIPAGMRAQKGDDGDVATATPIKHIVVIFQENVSFDHYFGTYPKAANHEGEPVFVAAPGTPSVNGLTHGLLTHNPNSAQPFRLDRSQNHTCDMNHNYTPEQQAVDHGLLDQFVEFAGTACTDANEVALGKGIVMGYYDGNTVTALWNYAQFFALNDNSYGTEFGPSTPGALNLVSGQTAGADLTHSIDDAAGDLELDVIKTQSGATVIGDADPFFDDCGAPDQSSVIGKNVGDLLNAKGITWGWFQGGFKPSGKKNGKAVCATQTARLDGTLVTAYSAHHDPFQYYSQSANPHHLPPTSVAAIGHTDQANHQYDLSEFWAAALADNLPAVSLLKANRAQDGHANNSTPLDEQVFLTETLNKLQSLAEWSEIAVIIAYDDSDGWYDHQMGPIINQSATKSDELSGPGACGTGKNALGGFQGRCGYGPRLPLLLISPYAKENFVDHTLTDQTSILRFIEDNWKLGRIGNGSFDSVAGPLDNMFDFSHKRNERVFLDTLTGEVSTVDHE